MPAPRTKWGVNAPVYRVLEDWVKAPENARSRLAPCLVPPNVVTALGIFAGAGVLYLLPRPGRWGWFVLLAAVRELCDILDGVLARGCDAGSRSGAILDVLSDTLYVWGAALIVATQVWPGRGAGDWAMYALALTSSVAMGDELIGAFRGTGSTHDESWIGRNSVLAGPLIMVGAKWFLVGHA